MSCVIATIGDALDLEIRASEAFSELTLSRSPGSKLIVSMPLATGARELAILLKPLCLDQEISRIVELWSRDDAFREFHIESDTLIVTNQRPTV